MFLLVFCVIVFKKCVFNQLSAIERAGSYIGTFVEHLFLMQKVTSFN